MLALVSEVQPSSINPSTDTWNYKFVQPIFSTPFLLSILLAANIHKISGKIHTESAPNIPRWRILIAPLPYLGSPSRDKTHISRMYNSHREGRLARHTKSPHCNVSTSVTASQISVRYLSTSGFKELHQTLNCVGESSVDFGSCFSYRMMTKTAYSVWIIACLLAGLGKLIFTN